MSGVPAKSSSARFGDDDPAGFGDDDPAEFGAGHSSAPTTLGLRMASLAGGIAQVQSLDERLLSLQQRGPVLTWPRHKLSLKDPSTSTHTTREAFRRPSP